MARTPPGPVTLSFSKIFLTCFLSCATERPIIVVVFFGCCAFFLPFLPLFFVSHGSKGGPRKHAMPRETPRERKRGGPAGETTPARVVAHLPSILGHPTTAAATATMTDDDCCPFADRVSKGLYLGDLRAMTSLAQAEAEEQADWCVVTVLSERDLAGLSLPRHVDHHLVIRADDDLAVDLTPEFARAHAVIASALGRGKSVLVHCMAGISRSATIAAAHLILERGIDAPAALAILRRHRRCIGPNAAFRRQLKDLAEANATRVAPCIAAAEPEHGL